MTLRDAVLVALLDTEASGYDLAKSFDASVSNFWMATPQQLYRELDRLADDGLISARLVHQERRPDKRVYSLTDAGHAAIRTFSRTAPKPGVLRDELYVKVAALDGDNAAQIQHFVTERRQWTAAKLERYERIRQRLLDGRTERQFLAEAARIGPYLTLLRGISLERDNIDWADKTLAVIADRLQARQ